MSSPTSKNEGRVGRVQGKSRVGSQRARSEGQSPRSVKCTCTTFVFFFQRQKAKSARGELCAGNKRKPKNKSKGKGRKYIEIEIEVYISLKARQGGRQGEYVCVLFDTLFGVRILGSCSFSVKAERRRAGGGKGRRREEKTTTRGLCTICDNQKTH